jgi:hypothetical protein
MRIDSELDKWALALGIWWVPYMGSAFEELFGMSVWQEILSVSWYELISAMVGHLLIFIVED